MSVLVNIMIKQFKCYRAETISKVEAKSNLFRYHFFTLQRPTNRKGRRLRMGKVEQKRDNNKPEAPVFIRACV